MASDRKNPKSNEGEKKTCNLFLKKLMRVTKVKTLNIFMGELSPANPPTTARSNPSHPE